ncbi:SDR family NAD(P)-dependent oxidoreductase [Parapedobacter sp. 10938]|uniref:SDR family NAD(P)-dependent oxidoreductase n=1 Tax=Parapedobacter flavus TaxID=3110225 RepID=UPI002DB91EE0|nr:SDR family oxidoreductase [Parapedobacter sp. 10938]MEC3878453.1 SDR family oxidoreductase [Parapedobacter sp. 10938]
MERQFEGQTAVISGGLGDIGFATAKALANRGANVALCDLQTEAAAAEQLRALEPYHVNYSYGQVDVADASAVRQWVDRVTAAWGTPSLIIANAAKVTLKGMYELTPSEWTDELDVNLNGAFHLTQYATGLLKEQQRPGRVVFVGSWAGANVHQHMPAYSVSKAAMTMLCKCMALELALHGILVNEIAPGYVNAGLSGRIWEENPGRSEIAKGKVPIKAVMSAAEVAENIVFLCHPNNTHMTGSTLLMDGGLSLKY